MGFYYRKCVNLGPFRVNLSKSGVGYSLGGRGFRVGTTARGKKYCLARSQRVSPVGLFFEQTTERPPSRLVRASASPEQESAIANPALVALSSLLVYPPLSLSVAGLSLLEQIPHAAYSMSDDLDRKHREMETAASRRETSSSLAGNSSRCGPEHGLREGAGGDEPSSRYTRPDRATPFIETTRGILSYSEIAPILAEQVLLVESRIYREDFSTSRKVPESGTFFLPY
jgi:hypothetical protein